MTWTLTVDSQSVTLPVAPRRVTIEYPVSVKEIPVPGNLPILLSFGRGTRKLQIEGHIVNGSMTKTQLITNYIDKLHGMTQYDVTISGASSMYNGVWHMTKFRVYEEGGYTASFRYTIEFVKGWHSGTGGHIVL